MPNIPTKRKNPFEKTLEAMREEQSKKEEKTQTQEAVKEAPKKAPAKKTAEKKDDAKKAPAKKAATKKATTKKATTKKAAAKPAKVKIDAKTGVAVVVTPKAKKAATKATTKKAEEKVETKKAAAKAASKKTPAVKKASTKPATTKETPIIVETPVEEINVVETKSVETPVIETPTEAPIVIEAPTLEVPAKKPRKISKRAQLLKEQKAAERAAAKAAKMVPVEIVRPEPKKLKLATKEEKAQFKKLEESFDYLVNLSSVVEEKTMNKDEITDITLGELHVIQMVKKFNNKPMTLIANNLKVTVGSLITCLNRLIQKDYIIRTRDEMDNRVILLSVTPKAQKVLKAHDKFHSDILGLLLENGVTLPQATKVLSTLNTVLEVYYDPIHNSFTKEEKGSKAKKK